MVPSDPFRGLGADMIEGAVEGRSPVAGHFPEGANVPSSLVGESRHATHALRGFPGRALMQTDSLRDFPEHGATG
jgi:hypothetical protein